MEKDKKKIEEQSQSLFNKMEIKICSIIRDFEAKIMGLKEKTGKCLELTTKKTNYIIQQQKKLIEEKNKFSLLKKDVSIQIQENTQLKITKSKNQIEIANLTKENAKLKQEIINLTKISAEEHNNIKVIGNGLLIRENYLKWIS